MAVKVRDIRSFVKGFNDLREYIRSRQLFHQYNTRILLASHRALRSVNKYLELADAAILGLASQHCNGGISALSSSITILRCEFWPCQGDNAGPVEVLVSASAPTRICSGVPT